jgi:UDP-N-acetylglucosamine enolpyruvyl transferase
MVLAGLISSWETKIDNIYWINRWYDDFIGKLKNLWAKIEETI